MVTVSLSGLEFGNCSEHVGQGLTVCDLIVCPKVLSDLLEVGS